MIDTHAHLVYEGTDPEAMLARAKDAGLQAVITCGYPGDLDGNLEVVKKHAGFVFLTLGLHPIDAKDLTDQEIEKYLDYVRDNKDIVLGIGEIGLDYHWFPKYKDKTMDERFKSIFEKCLELAKELGKPAILHTRKAEQDCFDLAVSHGMKDVLFHCYSGNITLARRIIDQGYMISLSTNIDRSKNTKKIAKSFPLESLLTETDTPFLSPIPDQKNEPANISFLVKRIAELRDMTVEEVDRQTTENALRFFGIEIGGESNG